MADRNNLEGNAGHMVAMFQKAAPPEVAIVVVLFNRNMDGGAAVATNAEVAQAKLALQDVGRKLPILKMSEGGLLHG